MDIDTLPISEPTAQLTEDANSAKEIAELAISTIRTHLTAPPESRGNATPYHRQQSDFSLISLIHAGDEHAGDTADAQTIYMLSYPAFRATMGSEIIMHKTVLHPPWGGIKISPGLLDPHDIDEWLVHLSNHFPSSLPPICDTDTV